MLIMNARFLSKVPKWSRGTAANTSSATDDKPRDAFVQCAMFFKQFYIKVNGLGLYFRSNMAVLAVVVSHKSLPIAYKCDVFSSNCMLFSKILDVDSLLTARSFNATVLSDRSHEVFC